MRKKTLWVFLGSLLIAGILLSLQSALQTERRMPLGQAVFRGRYDLLDKYLQEGYDVNRIDFLVQTPLATAVQTKQKGMVKILLDAGADVNKVADNSALSPLEMAIENKDVEVLQMLISHGVDVNRKGRFGLTPLKFAERDDVIRQILVANGARE